MNCLICKDELEEFKEFGICQGNITKHSFAIFKTENTFSVGLSFDGKVSYNLYHNVDGNYYFDVSTLKTKSIEANTLCKIKVEPFEFEDYEKVLSDLIDKAKNLRLFI